MTGLPEGAYATALACLPDVGPGWLANVLAGRAPAVVWDMLSRPDKAAALPAGRRGLAPHRLPELVAAVRSADVRALWENCCRAGIDVTWRGHPAHPASLSDGPAPCGVLFWRGAHKTAVRLPLVAVVGTRRCTPAGRTFAHQLGYELSAAGVAVVSGLALGIDGAAHAGAVAAFREHPGGAGGTVGVAASGVDVVYPRQHRRLWQEVSATGAVVSEAPPGRPAQAWRFPSRNRIIAGLCRLVVVVESHAAGGSWHTVEAALRRGTDVGAVPGPVHSPASVGTNKLLFDGALVVRSAADVLGYLGIAGGEDHLAAPDPVPTRGSGGTSVPEPVLARVCRALDWVPLCLDEIVERAGLPVAAVAMALEVMETTGEVHGRDGFWSRT